jgi:hypothetical protein
MPDPSTTAPTEAAPPPPLDELPNDVLGCVTRIARNVRHTDGPRSYSPHRPRHFAAIHELVRRDLVTAHWTGGGWDGNHVLLTARPFRTTFPRGGGRG